MFNINLLRAEPCVTTSFDMRVKRRSIARLLKVAQQPNRPRTRIAALDTGDFKLHHLNKANAEMLPVARVFGARSLLIDFLSRTSSNSKRSEPFVVQDRILLVDFQVAGFRRQEYQVLEKFSS